MTEDRKLIERNEPTVAITIADTSDDTLEAAAVLASSAAVTSLSGLC